MQNTISQHARAIIQALLSMACIYVQAAMLSSVAQGQPPVTALRVTPDQQQYVIGSQAGISCYRWSTQQQLATVPTQLEQVHDLVFSLDGRRMLAVGGVAAERGEAEVFDWPSLQLRERFSIGHDLLYAAVWLDDQQGFVAASADGHCYLAADDQPPRSVYQGHSRSVLAVAVLTDHQMLSAGVDQTIQLWDTRTGKRGRALTNHTDSVIDLALRPNVPDAPVQLASSGEDRTVRLWQPLIGRMMRFVRLDSVARKISWTADGGQLIAACDDGQVLWIDPESMSITRRQQSSIKPIFEVQLVSQQVVLAGEGGSVVQHSLDQ